MFNGVAKSRRELEEAVAAGIRGTVADSLCELRRIDEVARDLGRPARVLPQVDVNVTGGTHPGLETASGGKGGRLHEWVFLLRSGFVRGQGLEREYSAYSRSRASFSGW